MKLRRAMAIAAATAVIAPATFLAAPAAYATPDPSASTSATVSESPSSSESTIESPSASVSESASESPSTSPSESVSKSPSSSVSESVSPSNSSSAPASPSPSTSASEEPPAECNDSAVDVSISGLPGKIAAGSGWHKFSMNVHNTSDTTLTDLAYFAGAAGDELGEELFKSKHVELQAYDPETKSWEGLEGPEGEAVGFVGWSDELKPDYEVTLPLRLNVKAAAPVGAGFSLGASLYSSGDGECEGFGEVAYKFQIVKAGTDTGGTKPQEGGKVPVTTEKPSKGTSGGVVEGSLAETGSSSVVPTIGIIGGIAVVAGAGVVFTMKRRRANGATA